MFCKRCGREIDDDSVFCRKCGSRVTGEGADEGPGKEDQEQEVSEPANVFAKKEAPIQDTGEQDLWEGKRSPKKYFVHYLILGLLLAGSVILLFVIPDNVTEEIPVVGSKTKGWSGYVRFIPLVIVLGGLAVMAVKTFIFTHRIKYRLTSERFFVIKGIIARSMDELELIRVNDVVMHQGIWDRIMGIGRVTILSNDETTPEVNIPGIGDPEFVKEQIRGAASKKRGSGLYVERI